jgi:hypothetical protein
MTIRPIQRAEIEVFARFSADDDLNALFKDDMMRRWEEGASRPEWCFVAEEHGQVVGCIGYWGLPAFSIPCFGRCMEQDLATLDAEALPRCAAIG